MSRLARQTNLALQSNISKRNFLRNKAESSQIGLVVGHGTQVNAVPFTVPDNVHVVFLSDPGYVLSTSIIDRQFQGMVGNLRRFRNFIRGTLPTNNAPQQLSQRGWKWWDHIFQPQSTCPNLNIEFFDRNERWIDNLCGLWYAGPSGNPVLGVANSNAMGRKLYNRKMNLSEICQVADRNTRNHGGCILFITSCRIPTDHLPLFHGNIWYPEARMGLKTAFSRAGGMQNYPLPASRIVNAVRALESNASRIASRKRKMTGTGTFTRNTRARSNSNSNNNRVQASTNLNLPNGNNNVTTRRSQIMNVLNAISNRNNNITLENARARYANFFRGFTNENASSIIRNLRGNNGGTIKNNVRSKLRFDSANNLSTYRVNSGSIANRIVARIRNMS